MTASTSIPPRRFEEVEPLARAILAKVSLLDRRMKLEAETLDEAVAAWAEQLSESDVFTVEAMAGIKAHYGKAGAWPIMPGDLIGHAAKMPVTSSPERLRHWLRKWSYFPYSTVIQERCGLQWAPPEPPAEIAAQGSSAVRQFHRRAFMEWIGSNLTEIESRVFAGTDSPHSIGTINLKELEG
ncbi:hypothetical protein HOT75_gp077 [Gordonia phage Daredevil]|uniref:Uncharacterized protein n=1 Tax=Gordonia phage Daredevil TaxID=2283286 RepID=A0A345MIT3_9CAUD|nr:hypothetical protein HOT75_gp077 [Gordonia phage Daredevil]AXH70464.1 hypothetical protein SEA_DAREDEVIL_77 [Gordonia phage Daredevil]